MDEARLGDPNSTGFQIIMERKYLPTRRRMGIVFSNPAANKRDRHRVEGAVQIVRALRQRRQAWTWPVDSGPVLIMEILRDFRELLPRDGRGQLSTVLALERIAMPG